MTNPLKQYFRRPSLTVKLPSQGKFYPKGSIEMSPTGDLPVYPMTAIDEITAKTPDSLFNGSAIFELIKSCVPNIKDPWSVPSIDIDPLLIAIRSASMGNEMDLESECPSCKNISSYAINLVGLLQSLESGNYDQPIRFGELLFKFKPLSYKSVNDTNLKQFEIQMEINKINDMSNETEKMKKSSEMMKRLNESTFKLVAESIEYVELNNEKVTNKDYIYEFLVNTDKNTFEKIRGHGVNLRQKSEIKPINIKCVNCNHEYNQGLTLNVTDFFG